jgi:CRISPR-associated endonuclease/helicase Cas3
VDQSTTEAERLRSRLKGEGDLSDEDRKALKELHKRLDKLRAGDDDVLAISTLRGQFADNGQWRADPARPAIIVGTVDMIGSRLLFSGYGAGFRVRPLHAGFLGQDALLVHDEAHLEPAFQSLIERIEHEQRECEQSGDLPWPKLRVMALSATSRGNDSQAGCMLALGKEDHKHLIVQRRIKAKKTLRLHSCDDERKKLADQIVKLATSEHEQSDDAILIFVRGVDDALSISAKLEKASPDHVASLTGTMRGYERDELAKSNPVFTRFMPPSDRSEGVAPAQGTVYLVCTSAGEVGVNLSADHMVCDLSTFESMAQRLGRVNRFGDRRDTRVDVVCPESFDDETPNPQRKTTLDLLKLLPAIDEDTFDASPKALAELRKHPDLPCQVEDAFSPVPAILPTTDILFDAWALTSITQSMPGRPPVEPYLHGIADWQPPETQVAWRDEVGIITGELLDTYLPEDLLDAYPLKPHELLRDRSDRVFKHLTALARRHPDEPVWLCSDDGKIAPSTLKILTDKDNQEQIRYRTVLLPPIVGGLRDGMLNAESDMANDVADQWQDDTGALRNRVWDHQDEPDGMKLECWVILRDSEDETSETARVWSWFVRPRAAESASEKAAQVCELETHHDKTAEHVQRMVVKLGLPSEIAKAVVLAARFHDLGKARRVWQRNIGNREYPNNIAWAKSGQRKGTGEPTRYRHEFGSLVDVQDNPEFRKLDQDMRDLVLHLIAAHHGRSRPHFPAEEAFDLEPKGKDVAAMARDVPRRFARLQRRYGRWGLAYLESLVRAADYAASAGIPAAQEGKDQQS